MIFFRMVFAEERTNSTALMMMKKNSDVNLFEFVCKLIFPSTPSHVNAVDSLVNFYGPWKQLFAPGLHDSYTWYLDYRSITRRTIFFFSAQNWQADICAMHNTNDGDKKSFAWFRLKHLVIFICDGAYAWKNLTTTLTIMNRTDAQNVPLLFNFISSKNYFPSQ